MESDFIYASVFNLSINLIYTVIALVIGVAALMIIDRQILKTVKIEEELKNGNIAVAIFASTILIFVALIVSFGLKG